MTGEFWDMVIAIVAFMLGIAWQAAFPKLFEILVERKRNTNLDAKCPAPQVSNDAGLVYVQDFWADLPHTRSANEFIPFYCPGDTQLTLASPDAMDEVLSLLDEKGDIWS